MGQNKKMIGDHTALKLGIQGLRMYLKRTYEYELHVLSNTTITAAKDHGENYMKVRPPLVHHLLHNLLFPCFTVLEMNDHYDP